MRFNFPSIDFFLGHEFPRRRGVFGIIKRGSDVRRMRGTKVRALVVMFDGMVMALVRTLVDGSGQGSSRLVNLFEGKGEVAGFVFRFRCARFGCKALIHLWGLACASI